jgi:N-acetylneuraminate synthase
MRGADDVAHVTIIAEAGVNHNGDVDLALRLIDAAADAGADMVKFQTFKTTKAVTASAKRAEYQVRNTGLDDGQIAMLQALELDEAAHRHLIARCKARGLAFLSTPFDDESTDLLTLTLGLQLVKVGSGELTNGPHLLRLARRGLDVILSTGMATLAEVEEALGVLSFGYTGDGDPGAAAFAAALASPAGRAALTQRVTLLHCTSNYPAPTAEINLAVMDTFRARFPLRVGFSDHSDGIAVPIAAVGRGALMIEKHLTLDRGLPGPDHVASIEPPVFAEMVRAIREVELAIGAPEKRPTPSEFKTMAVARKSLVAARAIQAGEAFSPENLAAKRPGDGMAPNLLWELLGRPASRAYARDELIAELCLTR